MKIEFVLRRAAAACAAGILALALAGCGGGGGGGGSTGGSSGGGTTGGGTTGGGGTTTCTAYAVPSAPSIYNTVPANTAMTVQFSMAAFGNGAPITSYVVTAMPGNITVTTPATTNSLYSVNVTGLTNGTAYTFTAQAVNCMGAGTLSNSVTATPATVPDAPTIGTPTSGNGQVTVNFTPPTNNGGAAITGYTATSTPGGFQATSTGSPIVVTGLANGTSYTFTVTATNSMGNSLPSAASVAVTPSTVPGAPTGVVAMAGNTQATVSFIPPASNGGATVTSYTVTSTPGNVVASGTASPITVTGLTNGTPYTFTVTANNLDGSSVASAASNSAIPISNPGPYYVDPALGVDTNAGTSTAPFKTLTWALKVAAGVGTANTINAVAGTYNAGSGETFPLQMVNNVNLVGAGSATTTITGAGNYTLYGVARGTVLVVPPNTTSTLSGVTVMMGTAANVLDEVVVILDTSTSVTLTNDVITPGATTGVAGMYLISTGSVTLTGNTVNGTCQGFLAGALSVSGPTTLFARNNVLSETCNATVNVNGDGTVAGSPTVDLGTSASPGGNTINGGTQIGGYGVGIYIYGDPNWVYASGDTWHKNTQGANAQGQYTVGTIGVNPTQPVIGNNYAIVPNSSGVASAGLQF